MPGLVRPVGDERDALCAYLAQQRMWLRTAAYGLTDKEAARAPSASPLCVGGLIKHCTAVERSWLDTTLQRESRLTTNDVSSLFRMEPGETLAGLVAGYDVACGETDETLGELDLDLPVPVPRGVPWFPADVDAWSVRWVLLHLIQETARHAGHADIVRESIDGATSFSLLAAAEGQAETRWLKPWRRAERSP
ncbi:MAG TPA: DinB family protein [Acidimicrobiia bacterium]|jgi:hypothetical protein